jgi:hypothetical protein
MNEDRTITRRGLAILGWTLLMSLGLSQVVESSGLKWVQGVVWPSDIHTFSQLEPRPIDVAILGSSRASFGVSPSVLDECLGKALDRPSESVNLSRTFATAWSASVLAEELLGGERKPDVLVLAIGPEFFDENNPQHVSEIDANISLQDMPSALLEPRDLQTLIATMRPLGHGMERTALFLAGRHDQDAHLRWMMLHHGGGQYCVGSRACEDNNTGVVTLLSDRWDAFMDRSQTLMKARFKNYRVGGGPVHAHMLELIAWAQEHEVRLVLAELPMHREFRKRIPPKVWEAYQAHLDWLETEHGLVRFSSNSPAWAKTRSRYLDPDHLSDGGSLRYTNELCGVLAPLMEG